MTHIALYIVSLVVFLGLDALWLNKVAAPMFRRRLGDFMLEDPRLGVAGAFYAAYVAGVVYFAAAPALADGGPWRAALDGALLGLVAYGTYEITNLSTLKRWTAGMAALDIAWGAALTALAAGVSVAVVG